MNQSPMASPTKRPAIPKTNEKGGHGKAEEGDSGRKSPLATSEGCEQREAERQRRTQEESDPRFAPDEGDLAQGKTAVAF